MSGAATQRLSDAESRELIRTALGESLIVEASAGSGKTTELIRRIVNVVASGVRIEGIAAVTFTHKAAGELKLRLRGELDQARAQAADAHQRANLEDALKRLEEASIGTIHGFCAQILRERPVEAQVDPAFAEASPAEQERLMDAAFRAWLERRLNQDSPGLRRALSRLAWRESWETTAPAEQLKYAARQLIEWRDYPAPWHREPFAREEAIDTLAAHVIDLSKRVTAHFRPIIELATWITRSEEVRERDYDALESLLLRLNRDLGKIHRKGAEQLMFALDQFQRVANADLATELREEMLELLDDYELRKRQTGQLDFLDLLLRTRDLLRDHPGVRRQMQQRFTRLFVDEFQDTDPLQAEVLLLLAADDPDENDWLTVKPARGKLFVVGDPKQSIYKFRRADVALYQELRDRLVAAGVQLVSLRKSFRSTPALQECVNAAFAPVMTGDRHSSQAEYAPLEQHVPAYDMQPSVIALPVPRPYATRRIAKSAINESLPGAIVAFTDWLVRESGWTVRDPERPDERIAIRSRDICILFRRFLQLGDDLTRKYTRGLEERNLPHLLVGSKSFHSREEVETLRTAMAAIEWPDDELSVYATLRGSLFSITDAQLFLWRHEHQRLHPFAPRPERADPEIAAALDILARLHRRRNYRPVAETVNALLEATRAHAGFAVRPAGHQVLANVYRFAELARGFELEGGLSFRGFVEMLEQESSKTEAAEAPIVEEGADGVRLMTVHTAKGLEFPVVILADISANLSRQEPERYVDGAGRLCAMQLLRCAPWDLIAHHDREQLREQAEGVRIAYVAATRARDLLIVPAVGDEKFSGWLEPLNPAIYPEKRRWRQSREAPACPRFGETSVLSRPPEFDGAEEFSVRPGLHRPEAGGHSVVWWDPQLLKLEPETDYGVRQQDFLAEGHPDSSRRYAEWSRARRERAEQGARPQHEVFIATDLRPLPLGFHADVELVMAPKPPGRPKGGRFGTLVHLILRDVDIELAIPALAEVHGRLNGNSEEEVAAATGAVREIVRHPLWQRALAAERLEREWPVMCQVEGKVFEGIVDLAFFDAGVWHLVDFKTDADLDSVQPAYELQLHWYALAVGRITGAPVRCYLFSV